MTLGFPIHFISELCCTNDGTILQCGPNCQMSECGGFVRNGTLGCSNCGTFFTIEEGILNLLSGSHLEDESKHELQLRNEHATSIKITGPAWWENNDNAMEMIPTLEALSVHLNTTLLELGCGDGRYTTLLASQCQWILAVDFSIKSLRILQQRLKGAQNVGLVLGDVTAMKMRAAQVDRVFSTLVSNLSTREQRNAIYRLANHSLKSNGRFVFSTHHHGLRQRLNAEPKSGRYSDGHIYRYNFTVSECMAEVRPYFTVVKAWPIQICIPFARRLRLPSIALSRLLERIPLFNGLGELILCTVERPVPQSQNISTFFV